MPALHVLIELPAQEDDALDKHTRAMASSAEAERQAADYLGDIGGLGIEFDDGFAPVPMFSDLATGAVPQAFANTVGPRTRGAAVTSNTVVLPAEVTRAKMTELQERENVTVWPSSELTLLNQDVIDDARSDSGVDCRPFRPAMEIADIRALLGTDALWDDGYRGQNVVVGIIDEGVSGADYPVIGGFSRPDSARQPGAAPVTSHGSMCAADVLIAAPAARLYDYPFLGVPRSGGALQMFQAVLEQWIDDGTPQITNNSYGFIGVPDPASFPFHEVNNINHPVHRKVREVVAAGVTCFFAAGNCGQNCPSGACHFSGIGPGRSIHASNSLEEVVTVAAVNGRHERIGYSSQGPGMFEPDKPDISSYSHIFANFGPGRPGGTVASPFDSGTSCATPVAAGVAAALMSAKPDLTPAQIKSLLTQNAIDIGQTVGWDPDHGHGVISAAAAYSAMRRAALIS